jgi:ribonuclease Y
LFLLITAALSSFFTWFILSKISQNKISDATERAKKVLEEAEKDANTLKKEKLLEVKDEWYKAKQKFENDIKFQKIEIDRSEKKISAKETNMERRADLLNRNEKELEHKEEKIKEKDKILEESKKKYDSLIETQTKQLEKIASLSSEDAKKMLMESLVDKAKIDAAQKIKEIKEEAKLTANKEAREVVISAIQRSAADHSVESTVTVVNIRSDEMKGRIIGREGRNIRAFENATGCDIIVDDTPEAVVISGFDPYRREVARLALEKLISDGRIHPARIEDVVEKAEKDLEEHVVEIGEQTTLELGIHNVHPELIKLLGKLQYRTSYGQNVLQHTKEVANLASLMAAELGLDANVAKRAGLFHDIGKAIDKYTEGTHTSIGLETAKKYGENEIVQNAIASHHEDTEFTSLISVLVQAADAISGSRPGARRETLEGYIKRLEKLEEVAESFDGVSKTFAIQAGREIRVIVEHNKIDDAMSLQLSQDIADKIQSDMEYPGQIKVTVIREFRAVNYAK